VADLQPVDLVAYISSSRFFPQYVLSPKMLCFCSRHGNLKVPLSSYNSKDMTLDIYSSQRKHTGIMNFIWSAIDPENRCLVFTLLFWPPRPCQSTTLPVALLQKQKYSAQSITRFTVSFSNYAPCKTVNTDAIDTQQMLLSLIKICILDRQFCGSHEYLFWKLLAFVMD
jgi:hypothetical protein